MTIPCNFDYLYLVDKSKNLAWLQYIWISIWQNLDGRKRERHVQLLSACCDLNLRCSIGKLEHFCNWDTFVKMFFLSYLPVFLWKEEMLLMIRALIEINLPKRKQNENPKSFILQRKIAEILLYVFTPRRSTVQSLKNMIYLVKIHKMNKRNL